MEFPHLGQHCNESSCKKLDFLPIKCNACSNVFCNDHYIYADHNCPLSYKFDIQVPQCPLCNNVVPISRNQLPDIAVSAHIDNDCQADPALERRKVYVNKCSIKKCRAKELVKLICNECNQNYCLKHRHPSDHNCRGKTLALRQTISEAALLRQRSQPCSRSVGQHISNLQGNMSEDEALAKALELSMKEFPNEDADRQLARALQNMENQRVTTSSRNSNRTNINNCRLV